MNHSNSEELPEDESFFNEDAEDSQFLSIEHAEKWLLEALADYFGVEKRLFTLAFLLDLSALQLLRLMNDLVDELLPLLVGMIKKSGRGPETFQKLLGGGDADCIVLSEQFFARYESIVMMDEKKDQNYLLLYISSSHFSDLAWMNTRETFFKSERIKHVNEFLNAYFPDTAPIFKAGEQDKAWDWFYMAILTGDF